MKITRKNSNSLPEAFRFGEDTKRGLFVDGDGKRITAESLRAQLANPKNKMLRVSFFVRYRGDKPEAPLRKKTALAILGGNLNEQELARAVYRLAREQYE